MYKISQEDVASNIQTTASCGGRSHEGRKIVLMFATPPIKNNWKRTDSAKKAVVRHPDPKPDEKFLVSPSRILLPNLIRRSATAKGN